MGLSPTASRNSCDLRSIQIQYSKDKGMAVRVITLCFLVLISLAAVADSLTGKVVKITDGDTLYLLDTNYEQHKIPSL